MRSTSITERVSDLGSGYRQRVDHAARRASRVMAGARSSGRRSGATSARAVHESDAAYGGGARGFEPCGCCPDFELLPEEPHSSRSGEFPGATAVVRDASGLTSIYQRVPAAGYRLIEVIREPLPPTLLRIWSPLIASTAITLLVLVVPPARLASRTTTTISNAGGDSPIRPNLRWRVARVAAIVAALFGLNLGGVVSPAETLPPVRSRHRRLDYPNLFGGVPSALVFRTDSQTVVRLPVDWSDLPGPPAYGERDRSGGYRISEETNDYKTNGSIVAYGGSPGQMPFRSHVIRAPMRSLLEIWSPVVTSASITLLVLASLSGYVRGETVRASRDPPTSNGRAMCASVRASA